MTQAWAPVSVSVVASATGNLTQLFPPNATVGSAATTSGTLKRQACEGQLIRIDIDPVDANGGYLELWDVGGQISGASNNVNTGTTLTNAYVVAEQGQGRARMIWRQDFKGDAGLAPKVLQQRLPVLWGLAARYVNTDLADDAATVDLNIIADGCYRKTEICG